MTDDQATLERARRGDRDAFAALYVQHAPAAWRLALVVDRDPGTAAGAVSDAFARVLGTPANRAIDEPTLPVRLLQATRNAAIDGSTPSDLGLAVLDTPDARAHVTATAIAAFERMPERRRSVVWLLEVEGFDRAEVGAILGLTAENAVQLADRAFADLREQFAQAQIRSAADPDCQWSSSRLSGYVADGLSERECVRVRRHLDGCESCRTRLDAVDDLAPRLRRSVPSLPAAIAILAEEAWLAHTKGPTGRLGLRLPGGHPVPAWAERSLAGATAAVVSLGISAAVMLGGRGDGTDPQGPLVAADEPFGANTGESALGDGEPISESADDGATAPATTPAGHTATFATTTPAASTSSSDERPRAADSGSSAPAAPSPAPAPAPSTTAPPTTAPPTTAPSPAAPPTTAPPEDPVLDVVDDVLDPLDLCTGVGPVDGLTGCDDATESDGLLGP